jgi:hypothetical protein
MMLRLSRTALWLLAIASTGAYMFFAPRHVGAVTELDYIEGVVMDHIVRLAHGQPMYAAPSLNFVALAYMPGFMFASSLLARIFGPALWEPRLISFLATVVIGTLVGMIVYRETRQITLTAGAVGIYFMGFGSAGGGHYIVARPDSMMLALALGGLATLRYTKGAAGAVVAALLLTLGFFTKQHAIWFGAAVLPWLWLDDRKRLMPFALTWIVGCAGVYALLSAWLGPWFSFYTFDVPSHWSHLSLLRIQRYLGPGVLGMLGPLSVVTIASLAIPGPRIWRGPAGLWAWVGLGALGTGLLATFDPSAWHHVFIPTTLALAILGPMSYQRLVTALGNADAAATRRAYAIAFALLASQFIPLVYGIHLQLPHAGARETRDAFLEKLKSIPGPVLVVDHGFYSERAGKPMGLQIIAISDLERAYGNRLYRSDPHYFDRLFDPLRRGPGRPALLTDDPLETEGSRWASIAPAYRLADTLGTTFAAIGGLHGHRGYPSYFYVPVDPPAGGEAAAAPAGGASSSTPAGASH